MSKKTLALAKYLKKYHKNPKSRVFAPLGNCYRELGLLFEAKHILKKGLVDHPEYALAHLYLAKCYVDEHKYYQAYQLLKDRVSSENDNLFLLEEYANICLNLGYANEALHYFEKLHYLDPRNEKIKSQIQKLSHAPQVFSKEESLEDKEQNIYPDDWVQFDLSSLPNRSTEEIQGVSWLKEDDTYQGMPSIRLVELYRKQGLYSEALDVLEKLIYHSSSKDELLEEAQDLKMLIEQQERYKSKEAQHFRTEIENYKRDLKREEDEGSSEYHDSFNNFLKQIYIRAAKSKLDM